MRTTYGKLIYLLQVGSTPRKRSPLCLIPLAGQSIPGSEGSPQFLLRTSYIDRTFGVGVPQRDGFASG